MNKPKGQLSFNGLFCVVYSHPPSYLKSQIMLLFWMANIFRLINKVDCNDGWIVMIDNYICWQRICQILLMRYIRYFKKLGFVFSTFWRNKLAMKASLNIKKAWFCTLIWDSRFYRPRIFRNSQLKARFWTVLAVPSLTYSPHSSSECWVPLTITPENQGKRIFS
jgi:hypothetical protein